MNTYDKSSSTNKCPCSRTCEKDFGFQKILDLKQSGLILYRHTSRKDEINKITGLLESSIKTTNDVFILQNTTDNEINAIDCVSAIVGNISCPRCRELVKRAQKYLKNVPSITKKHIISVCDHCKSKQKTHNYCNECRKVEKKFFEEQDKQSVAKEKIKIWLEKIQQFLNNIKQSRNISHCRTYSEIYLNRLCVDNLRVTQGLDVAPMLKTKARISDMIRSINDETSKSDSALIFLDAGVIKNTKNVLTATESFHHVDRVELSSISTHDMSENKESNKNKETFNFSRLFEYELEGVNNFEQNNIKRQSPHTINKYYSDEEIFFSTADHAGSELKKMFSYVFPKKLSEDIKHFRRVKSSAELIIDTQEMLRQRSFQKSTQRTELHEVTSSVKGKKAGSVKFKAQDGKNYFEYDTSVETDKTSSIKNGKMSTRDKQEKTKINKEIINPAETTQKDKEKKQTFKLQPKEKTNQMSKDKKEKLGLSEEKIKGRKGQLKKEKDAKLKLKSELLKVKDAKDIFGKEKDENQKAKIKLHTVKDKKDLFKKEKEEKQKIKSEIQKVADVKDLFEKDEKLKIRDGRQKIKYDKTMHINEQEIEPSSKLDEENKRALLEPDMTKEVGKKMNRINESTSERKKVQESKKQKDQTTKELNISQVKMRKPSTVTDDLILQLVKLKQTNNKNEKGRPQRLSQINVTPLMINEHKIHKARQSLACAICVDSELELDVENIVNKKNKPESVTDIILGNKIIKSKLPLRDKEDKEEIIPILYKSLFKEDVTSVHQNNMIADITMEDNNNKALSSLSNKNVSTKIIELNTLENNVYQSH